MFTTMFRTLFRNMFSNLFRSIPTVYRPRTFLLLSSLLLAALVTPASGGEIVEVDGFLHVRNSDQPAEATQTRHLTELWRAGGEDDEVFFGLVVGATTDRDGNVYLLDGQLSEIQVYSPTGEHLRTLGREGDGPGEFRRAQGLVNLPNDQIGAVEQMPGKIVVFERDGTPASNITPGDPTSGRMGVLWDAQGRGEHLVLSGQRITPGQDGMQTLDYLTRCDTEGNEQEHLLTKTGEMDFQRAVFVEKEQYFVNSRWALGDDGRVYAPPERDRYLINVYAPDGTLERVIEREFTPRKRTQAENDRIGRGMVIIVNNERVEMDRDVEETAPCIASMFVDAKGQLWVENANSLYEGDGIACRYDIFDPEGHFVRQVDLLGAIDPLDDGFTALGDGRFVQIKNLTAAADAMLAGLDETGESSADTDVADDSEVLEVVLLGTTEGI